MTFLFLGVGNLERADDGAGPFVAQKLADDAALARRGVDVLPHGGEGVSLMQLWEGIDKVVIVDAMKTGGKLGSVRRFDAVKEALHGGVFRYSSHLFGLAEAVEVSRRLGKLPGELVIYGIEGREFAFGKPFSKPVARAVAQVIGLVREEFGAFAGEKAEKPSAAGKAKTQKKAAFRKTSPKVAKEKGSLAEKTSKVVQSTRKTAAQKAHKKRTPGAEAKPAKSAKARPRHA